MTENKVNQISVKSSKTLGTGNHCWYCGALLFSGIKSKDHFWPKHLGGNLKVWSCWNCNALKGHRTPLQFISFLNELKEDNPSKEILNPMFNRMIHATQTLWDRIKWSLISRKMTIFENTEDLLR